MIVEGILNIFFGVVSFLLGFLPNLHWVVNADYFTKFFEVLRVVCYFLPMGTVVTIFGLIVAINLFKIAVALIKTLLSLLPFF